MTVDRQDPPFVADERTMLESWLDFHRATLLLKCDGLTPDQARERSVPPSPLSLHGLVRHMADVERNWFSRVLDGEETPGLFWHEADEDADFNEVDDAHLDADLETWHAEVANARAVLASFDSLDAVGRRRRHGQDVSVRWVLVHMIEEYARHNGHADFLRERIDGTVGD